MTVIVYRDGYMAADTRAYSGGDPPLGRKQKITRLPDGSLAGASSGRPGTSESLFAWARRCNFDTMDLAEPPSFSRELQFHLLIVRPDGSALFADDDFHFSGPIEADYYAIGSGKEYALGALGAGFGAKQAAEVACMFDPVSGLPVTTLHHVTSKRTVIDG